MINFITPITMKSCGVNLCNKQMSFGGAQNLICYLLNNLVLIL